MPGLPALAAPTEPMAGANLTPVNQVKEASLATERNLFEYIAQQSQANSLGSASALANPSALANQVSRHLRGFMERSGVGQQTEVSGKGRAMGANEGSQTVNTAQADGPQLHAGPARENLTPSQPGTERAEGTQGVSENDFDHIINALSKSMDLMIEASVITSGASNVMKSFQTIMRGQ